MEDTEALKGKEKDNAIAAIELNATTFKIKSGDRKIVPGCVVREETIKTTKKK